MSIVDVGSDIFPCTHQVSLSDGKTTLGFVVSDSKGNNDPNNLTRNPISRTAIKTSSSDQTYSDMEPPWLPITQTVFKGGRGMEDHAKDSERYFDSYRCQASFDEIYNGPLDYYARGFRTAQSNFPGSVSWLKLQAGTSKYVAVSFAAAASYTSGQISILVRRCGTPDAPIRIELCGNNAGNPGAVLKFHEWTVNDITDTISEFKKFTFAGVNLTSGQTYWIKVTSEAESEVDYWFIGIKRQAGTTSTSSDNTLWQASAFDLYYRITDAERGRKTRFFTYRYLRCCVWQLDSGDPKIFINGTLGVADSNSGQLNKLIDNSKAWATDQWAGAMVGIIAGAGFEELSVYRRIVSNDATSLTLDTPFAINQDTTTQYAIIATDLWTEIPATGDNSHGLTGHVTDVCVINDIIYFAQGDHKTIRRMRWVVQDNDGGWVSEDEESNATYLATVRHASRGLEIWRANNDDKNHDISVSRAAVIDWLGQPVTLLNQTTAVTGEFVSPGVDFNQGDNVALEYKLTLGTIGGDNHPYAIVKLQGSNDNQVFETVEQFPTVDAAGVYYLSAQCTFRYRRVLIQPFGSSPSFNDINIVTINNLRFHEPLSFHDSFGKINNIIEYSPETSKNLWILREGMVFNVKTDNLNTELDFFDPISLPELAVVMEENNGRATGTSNVYLYFGVGNGIQRYYSARLDSDGPDLDAGLPTEKQGPVSAILGYPGGMYFATVDAGTDGYSTILLNNSSGWHELYRAPNKGERIFSLSYQAIPTSEPDRLWFNVGDDIAWLSMPSKTLKATYDAMSEYTHESVFVSSWYYTGMADIEKLWNSLKLMTESLETDVVYIEADYQVDQETEWHPLPYEYSVSPSQEILFAEQFGVTGKRFRYRLRLMTEDKQKTPRVKSIVIEALGRAKVKYSFSFPYRNIEGSRDLMGNYEPLLPVERQAVLDEWVDKLTPLELRSDNALFDNKRVYLEAITIGRAREYAEGTIGTIVANEI